MNARLRKLEAWIQPLFEEEDEYDRGGTLTATRRRRDDEALRFPRRPIGVARIALCANPENVPLSVLDDIALAADLPAGKVCLLVGDHLLGDDYQGLCVPRAFVGILGNIGGLEDHLETDWDCGVMLHPKWAVRQPTYPAYFAYLLGHEFGHAKTALAKLPLAVYEALMYDVPAVSGQTGWRQDDLPQEIRYDQFGLAVAEATYGLEALHEEINRLLDSGLEQDERRLRNLLDREPRLDLEGLFEDMAEFSRPYQNALIERWADARQSLGPGFTRYLQTLDALWRT